MMWEEFEKIAGYEVSYEDYKNIIEPMYMAIPEGISKAEFVKMLNKKRFAIPTAKELINEIRKEAKHLKDICGYYTDYDSEHKIDKIARQYAKRKYGLDWLDDPKIYVYFKKEYEYEGMRGCSYPCTLVIGRMGDGEYGRVNLFK